MLLAVLAISALAVPASPVLISLIGRRTGWLLAVLYAVCWALLLPGARESFHGHIHSMNWPWVAGFQFSLRADALSYFFLLLALGIGVFVFAYSGEYFHDKKGLNNFYLFMTGFMASVLLLVMANDVAVLFIGWELVSLGSFFLIARAGSGGETGAVRTLILTFTGGLLLLVSLALAVGITGSTTISEILASPAWAEHRVLTPVVAIIFALAAFSKAAQLPFHFWLPEAMAAATPVSAFLHAAAVVKAGIYVLIRFSAVFGSVYAWNMLLIWVGIITAVMAAFFAVSKTDLKQLTAYSTVSHLGWIVATIGVGTKGALVAALVHTLAHAMFKSSVFMLIGCVDHQTHTRDIRRLGRLYSRMPWTFGSMLIACLSMASVPPFLGFVSKEGMLQAFEQAPMHLLGTCVLFIVALCGAVLSFMYSARIIFGGFIDGHRDMSFVKEAPVALWLPAALPAVLSVPVVGLLSKLNEPLDAAVGAHHVAHIALWHGMGMPLIISVLALLLGIGWICQRDHITLPQEVLPWSGNRVLNASIAIASKWARLCNRMVDSFSPTRHLASIFIAIVAYAVFCLCHLLLGGSLAPRNTAIDRWPDIIPLFIIALSVAGIVRTRSRLRAVALLSTTGVGVTLMILGLGAPDVAMTQFLVELLTVVVMMMVARRQPRKFIRTGARHRPAAIAAVVMGLVSFFGVWALIGRHSVAGTDFDGQQRSTLAMWYINNAPRISTGDNIVNTILVEFRGFDTMGELTVLGMAGVAIAAVVMSMPRQARVPKFEPDQPADAGLNAQLLRHLSKILIPVLGVVSFIIFMRGHQNPGGGFIAALVAGGAIMIHYLTPGVDRPLRPLALGSWLTGIGVTVAIATGLWGLVAHGSYLYAMHGHALGQHWSSAMLFDAGVYLSVLGMITMAINMLGGPERPGREREREREVVEQ